jgi:predicted HicB family RNase H-like nuclease
MSPVPAADHYLYIVGWSEEDETYVARVAEFSSLAAHGDTPEAALQEIKKVVRAVLKDLAVSNEPIPEPYGKRSFSGRLHLRLPEYLHRQLVIEATQQGVSLNQLINLKLEAPLSAPSKVHG